MKLRSALLAAGMLALPAAAMAQPVNGVYVGGGLGYNWSQNVDVKSFTAGGASVTGSGATLNGDGGFAAVVSAGYGYGNGLRVELEGNYRGNHSRLKNAGAVQGGADTNMYGVMLNGLYDFNLGRVNPYVGAGIGYELTGLRGGHAYIPGSAASINLNNDSRGSLASQAILGVAIPTGVPGLAVTAEYRFLATFEDEKFNGSVNVPGVGSAPASIKIGNQYNHAALIGVRYAFGVTPVAAAPAPAPAPVAAPAPAPARTYLVFFDWDKADLTDRARQIIAEAAQNSTRVQLTQIEVSGHADRTGTASYNMALSRKRANNVAAELVRLGVPSNVISIQAFGDSKPLVPTAAGVREPQNRRVEIVLK
jgi:OmpA-OmpF porin, OOP family